MSKKNKDEINQVTIPPEIPDEEPAEAAADAVDTADAAVDAAAGDAAPEVTPLPGEMTRKERKKAKKAEKKELKRTRKEAKRHTAKRTKAQNFWLSVLCIVTAICMLVSCFMVVKTYRNLDGHDAGKQAEQADETTTASSNSTPAPGNTTPTPAEPGSGGDAQNGGQTADNQAILAKYTEVMDKLKAEVATYTKKEYQDLPKDKLDMGALASMLQPIIAGMMTSEDKAEEQQRDDAAQIPIIKCAKGCMLTDVSAIKSASMTEEGGKTTIVITLNDEKNSLPAAEGADSAPSAVGGIFNPMSKEDIDEKIASISVVTVNQFEITYTDCTATLVFDTESLKVESLTQIMNAAISADAKAAIIHVNGTGLLINTMKIYNVTYK